MAEFIDSVKNAMAQQGIGVSELSARADVGRQYMYRILSGECVPTIAKAESIAKALGMKLKVTNLK